LLSSMDFHLSYKKKHFIPREQGKQSDKIWKSYLREYENLTALQTSRRCYTADALQPLWRRGLQDSKFRGFGLVSEIRLLTVFRKEREDIYGGAYIKCITWQYHRVWCLEYLSMIDISCRKDSKKIPKRRAELNLAAWRVVLA
jgi:hypothetical protein